MDTPLTLLPDGEKAVVRAQLSRILASPSFQQSRRRQRFLEFIVTEALAGRGDKLKGYNVGVDVFEKPVSFDPLVDPIVRIEAGRLRDKLREYYEAEGQADPIRIDLPKGSYVPQFEFRAATGSPAPAPPAAADNPDHSPGSLDRTPRPWMAAAALAALLLLVASAGTWRSHTPEAPRSEKASIAVLPFEAIGNDPAWRRFADGITEDIVTDLSRSKDLFVVARHSTEVYRGLAKDVRSVGHDLGVRYVLEGSIQPAAERIHVTAKLIDTHSGGHVWSNRYSRPAADLFEVQSDVTQQIAVTLSGYQGAVAEAERTHIRRKPPGGLTAYQHYLLGMEAKHGGAAGGITKAGLEEAERQFNKALEVDPQLARAYVGLAYVYEYRLDLGLGPSAEANVAGLMEVARQAVSLDPYDGEAQLVLGHAYTYMGQFDQALEQFARAESLAPSSADVLILIAWYLPPMGQTERAAALAGKVLKLNPNYPGWYNQGFRYIYFFNGQFAEALKHAKLVTEPAALDHAFMAAASAMTGDLKAARSAADEAARLDPNWYPEKFMSDNGGFPDSLARLFVDASRKAGLPACVPAAKLAQYPDLKKAAACEAERASGPPG